MSQLIDTQALMKIDGYPSTVVFRDLGREPGWSQERHGAIRSPASAPASATLQPSDIRGD